MDGNFLHDWLRSFKYKQRRATVFVRGANGRLYQPSAPQFDGEVIIIPIDDVDASDEEG